MKKTLIYSALFLTQLLFSAVAGDWSGILHSDYSDITLVLHIASDKLGELTAKIDTLEYELFNMQINTVSLEKNNFKFTQKNHTSYQGILNIDHTKIIGTFTQRGKQYPLLFSRDNNTLNRQQNPIPPYPYLEEKVRYQNQETFLSGTLTLPQNGNIHPAIILIAGSGLQDRDASFFKHKPFHVLANHLTCHGIAVLRFDKRGVNQSTGSYMTATHLDFVNDVLAGIEHLKARKDIGFIGLIGHSEGGIIATIVATHLPDISCLVLMASPAVNGEELLYKQSELIQRAAGVREQSLKEDLALRKALITILKNEIDPVLAKPLLERALNDYLQISKDASLSGIEFTQANANGLCNWINMPSFRFFLSYDPSIALRKITIPVLAINGMLDLQVDSKQNLPVIEQALYRAGNKSYTVLELPGINHMFQPSKTGALSEYRTTEETISLDVLDLITEWILKPVNN